MQILTGGSPQLIAIVARFGAGLSFRELMANLRNLVDDHTEYFKSHLEALPAQERRVYLALAELWKPASAREIANRVRIGTSQCSAQLARLITRGAVETDGGTRRKLYYLTERLFNIYYLMRRSPHGQAPLVEALVGFMESYYWPSELRRVTTEIARDRYEQTIEAAGRALDREDAGSSRHRWRGLLIRARAALEDAAMARDVDAALAILPTLETLPEEVPDELTKLCACLGLERTRELIVTSPAADLLLPFTTALELELGVETRVAREVEEVAQDIRRAYLARH